MLVTIMKHTAKIVFVYYMGFIQTICHNIMGKKVYSVVKNCMLIHILHSPLQFDRYINLTCDKWNENNTMHGYICILMKLLVTINNV